MTITADRSVHRRSNRRVAAVTLAGAIVLGAVDLLLQVVLPYPWANLANSPAAWALCAVALGAWIRTGQTRAAVAGAVLLVGATEVYYLAAAVGLDDDLSELWSGYAAFWMAGGVAAGVIFGVAGIWIRSGNRPRQVVGTALAPAVLVAEAVVDVLRRGDAQYRHDSRVDAAVNVVLAVAFIVLVARTPRQRLESLAVTVPLVAVGFVAFAATGFVEF